MDQNTQTCARMRGLSERYQGKGQRKESSFTDIKEIATIYREPDISNNSMDPRTTSKGTGQEIDKSCI